MMLNQLLLFLYITFLIIILFFIFNIITRRLFLIRSNKVRVKKLVIIEQNTSVFKGIVTTIRLALSFLALVFVIYPSTGFLISPLFIGNHWLYYILLLLYVSYDEHESKAVLVRTFVLFAICSIIIKTRSPSFEFFFFNQKNLATKSFLNFYFSKDILGFFALSLALIESLKHYLESKRVTTLVYLVSLFSLFVVVYFGGAMPPMYLSNMLEGKSILFSIVGLASFVL